MRVECHHDVSELDVLIAREKSAPRLKRLRSVRLAMDGLDAPTVAERTGYSRRAVQQWVARYNAGGLAGLEDGKRPGRKPPLDAEGRARLCARLDAGATPEDGVCTLRGEDVRRVLAEEFGLVRSLGAVYHLLHKLGYSSLMPRPAHHRGDPERREAFKKASPAGSRK